MLLIWIVVIAMVLMARKPRRRRRMGRYIRGDINEVLTLTTLGAGVLTSTNFDNVVNERTLVSSVVGTYSMTAFTKSTGDGPILVGIAHSDYSSAEIQEVIDATASWDEGDLVAREVGARKVRRIGIFDNPDDEAAVSVLNDGKPIRTKLNWILLQGQTLKLWSMNLGTSPLATTAPLVRVEGHANLFPK